MVLYENENENSRKKLIFHIEIIHAFLLFFCISYTDKVKDDLFWKHEFMEWQRWNENEDNVEEYEYVNILRLAMIASLFMNTAAEAERGYSSMNDMKTKKRARLETGILSDIMMIRMNGPESMEEFDKLYDDIFNQWYYATNYRQKLKTHELNEHIVKRIRTKKKSDNESFADMFKKAFITESDVRYKLLGFDNSNESSSDDDTDDSSSDDETIEEILSRLMEEEASTDDEDDDDDVDLLNHLNDITD